MKQRKPMPLHHKVQIACVSPRESRFLLFRVNQQRGGFWQNITGSVEKNEDHLSAAIREIHEETGLTPNEYNLTQLPLAHRFPTRHFGIINEQSFVMTFKDKPKIILSDEHQDCCWYHFHEILNIQFGYISNIRSLLFAMGYADV